MGLLINEKVWVQWAKWVTWKRRSVANGEKGWRRLQNLNDPWN